jgi:peptidoglycan hydrolase-like protein with peptidoglycan-binding domain
MNPIKEKSGQYSKKKPYKYLVETPKEKSYQYPENKAKFKYPEGVPKMKSRNISYGLDSKGKTVYNVKNKDGKDITNSKEGKNLLNQEKNSNLKKRQNSNRSSKNPMGLLDLTGISNWEDAKLAIQDLYQMSNQEGVSFDSKAGTKDVLDILSAVPFIGKAATGMKQTTSVMNQLAPQITKSIFKSGAIDGINEVIPMEKKRKYRQGTGMNGVMPTIPSPNDALVENQLMLNRAEATAENNIWTKAVIPTAGALLTKFAGAFGQNKLSAEQNEDEEFNIAELGMSNTSGNVEAEGDEVIETPNGQVEKLKGPSHAQGGIDLDVPDGTKIYSDKIKIEGKTMAERKQAREKRLDNLLKVGKSRTGDRATNNSIERSQKHIEAEEAKDLSIQEMANAYESMRGQNQPQQFKFGGITGEPPPKYVTGATGYDLNSITNAQTALGVTADGKFGKNSKAALLKFQTDNKLTADGILGPKTYEAMGFTEEGYKYTAPVNNYSIDKNSFKPFGITDNASADVGKADLETPMMEMDKMNAKYIPTVVGNNSKDIVIDSQEKGQRIVGGFMPTIGDLTSLTGNMISSFSPLQNVMDNRAGDTGNINAFENYGKNSLETINESKGIAAQLRDKSTRDVRNNAVGSRRRLRGSARGISQQRAGDLAVDMGVNEAENNVNTQYLASQLGILQGEAQMESNVDQVRMGGEQAKDLANRQDRDNFYTQKGAALVGMGKGLQETGKDVNSMYENDMNMKMLNQMSKYFQFDSRGNITGVKTEVDRKTKKRE